MVFSSGTIFTVATLAACRVGEKLSAGSLCTIGGPRNCSWSVWRGGGSTPAGQEPKTVGGGEGSPSVDGAGVPWVVGWVDSWGDGGVGATGGVGVASSRSSSERDSRGEADRGTGCGDWDDDGDGCVGRAS